MWRWTSQSAIRDGDWKLLGNAGENVRPEGIPELTGADKKGFLVNLKDDIGETRNVAKENPEVLQRLLKMQQEYAADLKN